LTGFPQSAAYGKKIPFATLRRQGIAPRYGDFIKSLVWAYKLSPETMQLAATDSVREIEVMDLAVKDKCSGLRSQKKSRELNESLGGLCRDLSRASQTA
jgi:hypothetical protein